MLSDFNQLKQQLMLSQFFNGGLEIVLNGLIQRSKDCENHLRKLDGKTLAVHLTGLDTQIYFIFSARHIDLLEQYESQPNCAVTISPSLLFHPPKKSELTRYINDKSIVLDGDLQVLQDFIGLIEHLEKDPSELLSPYVGDVIAQSTADFVRKFTEVFKHRVLQSQRYWGERLTEEYQFIAPALAVADFCDQVKTLEKQTALLEQKINQLHEN